MRSTFRKPRYASLMRVKLSSLNGTSSVKFTLAAHKRTMSAPYLFTKNSASIGF